MDQILEKVVAFAQSEGYDFTKGDLISFQESLPNPVVENQLDAASGCAYYVDPRFPNPLPRIFRLGSIRCCMLHRRFQKSSAGDHKCFCFFGGGGSKDSYRHFICCVGVGYLV
ncbi:Nif11-like leader peptide family natural product precursor [Raoultibacter phocaeensis]|uniref:Nif11-like leader peptide family natural product precursor n=1 Tax=Raoultibacter phocaeensis TaxID=2479841 RepID=UPI00111847C7